MADLDYGGGGGGFGGGYGNYGTLSPYSRFYEPTYAELARNRGVSDRPGYDKLGSSLGNMFFGGAARDAHTQNVFNTAAEGQVKLEDLIMKARKERDTEIGRQGMVQRAIDAGHSDIADMIRNSPNAASAGEAQLHGQELGWGDKEWELANSPAGATDAGMELMARMGATRKPGLMPLTKDEGGVLVNQYRTPGDQGALIETPGQQALDAYHGAAAGHQRALTGEAGARTAFITGPQTQAETALALQRQREAAAVKPQQFSAEDLKANFPDGAGGVDEASLNDFQRFQAQNGIRDPHDALLQYRKLVYTDLPDSGPPPAAPAGARSELGQMFDGVTSTGWGGPQDAAAAAAANAPSDAAVAFLRKNSGDPQILAQFKKKYGQDPAQYLGGPRQKLLAPPSGD